MGETLAATGVPFISAAAIASTDARRLFMASSGLNLPSARPGLRRVIFAHPSRILTRTAGGAIRLGRQSRRLEEATPAAVWLAVQRIFDLPLRRLLVPVRHAGHRFTVERDPLCDGLADVASGASALASGRRLKIRRCEMCQ